jgi:reactive intermediate/imine deaminase
MCRRVVAPSRLLVLEAERVAQQRAVARRAEELLKVGNHYAKIRGMKSVIQTKDAPAAIGTYSQAVRAGDTVYLSGQIGLDPATMQMAEGVEAQTHRVFRNLAAVADAAGLKLDHAVRMTVYLTDLAHFARVNEIMAQYVREPYPARAAVGVASLPRGALVEIDAILHAG